MALDPEPARVVEAAAGHAGVPANAAWPMQLMFPEGDRKWTSRGGFAVGWATASASAMTAAITAGSYGP